MIVTRKSTKEQVDLNNQRLLCKVEWRGANHGLGNCEYMFLIEQKTKVCWISDQSNQQNDLLKTIYFKFFLFFFLFTKKLQIRFRGANWCFIKTDRFGLAFCDEGK